MRVKRIWIMTLFPELVKPFFECGIAGSAFRGERGPKFEINFVNPREFSPKNYKGVDDAPYGGGPGMVIRADILKDALIKGVVEAGFYGRDWKEKLAIVFPGPRGKKWDMENCKDFSRKYLNPEVEKDIVFICGRYEGIDERFLQLYVDFEYSLGDFVLTGGELAVMTMLDSAVRFTSGALGNADSLDTESFCQNLLEYPQYTRPREFDGALVPEVLLSGDHAKIEKYKEEKRLEITKKYRPDLLS